MLASHRMRSVCFGFLTSHRTNILEAAQITLIYCICFYPTTRENYISCIQQIFKENSYAEGFKMAMIFAQTTNFNFLVFRYLMLIIVPCGIQHWFQHPFLVTALLIYLPILSGIQNQHFWDCLPAQQLLMKAVLSDWMRRLIMDPWMLLRRWVALHMDSSASTSINMSIASQVESSTSTAINLPVVSRI